MTTPRDHHSSTLLNNGEVLVAGGEIDSGGNNPCSNVDYHGSAEIYNPRTDTFTATGMMTDSRFDQTATTLPNGQVVVAGGGSSGVEDGLFICSNLPTALPWTDLYNPTTGVFSSTGAMHSGRWLHNANLLPKGLILVAGGLDSNGNAYSSAELYAPSGAVNIGAPQLGETVSGIVSIGTEISTRVQWINIYIDGNYLASSPPFTFSWDSTKVGNGPHIISANACDGSGLLGTSAVSINVANGPVALTWPPTGSTVSRKVGIGAQVTSGVEWIHFYVDGNWIASSLPGTIYWDSTTVGNGQYILSVRAYGSAGQIGSDNVPITTSN